MAALVAGVLAGFARLGIAVPTFAQALAGEHGALMVCAFFGTVISLERAVALGRAWAYLGPLCAGAGGLALLAGLPLAAVQSLFLAASAVLAAGSLKVWMGQPSLFAATLLLGALLWVTGNAAWIGSESLLAAVPAWMAFLVVTIAGERLELTRLLPPRPGARRMFIAAICVIVAGIVVALAVSAERLRLLSLGLLLLSVWLLRFDIARRNVRERGLPRFVAISLLSGYGWLAMAGGLGLAGALVPAHPWRDAALHAVFLGFVFSMVLGHAPIVLPAVMKIRLPYSPAFYLPLLALHASVLARLAAVLDGNWDLRQWAAVANAAALALFVATLLLGLFFGRRRNANR
jgi:hypothetical protein